MDIKNLDALLSDYFGSKVDILKQDITSLTKPGEHFGSRVLKVDVDVKSQGEVQTLNLVAKQIPVSELLQRAFDVQVTFKKEAFTYTVTIPTLIEFQKEHQFPDDKLLTFFPKCLGVRYNLRGTDEEVDTDGLLLFENLKCQGYETIDRHIGFDLESAKIVVGDLGKFHAVPIALRKLNPTVFEEKIVPCFARNKGAEQLGEEVINAFHNSIMLAVRKSDELTPYFDRVQKVVDYYATHAYTSRPEPSQDYGTISHSDVWTSNLMISRNSEKEPIKQILLDFQLTNYSSAIRDLVFFLFTSVQNDILENHFDNFIKIYYDSFYDTLKYFPIDLTPYSWDNFNTEFKNVAPDEVYHILFMLKIIFSRKGKVQNSNDHFEITDWTRDDLIGEEHRIKMRDTVLALVSRSLI